MIIKLMKNRKNIGELVGSLSDKLLLTLFGGLLLTNISFAGQMKDISVLSLPDDKVQIKFKFDSSVADPKVFTIDGEPVRVVFDFADVSNGLKQRNRDVGLGLATRITTVEAGGRTRAVVYLQDKAPYSVTNSGSEVSVVIGEKQSGMSISKASSGVASVSSGSSAKVAADSGEPMISNIDFRRGEAGEGRVIITLTDPSAAVDVRSEGGLLVADFADLKVPAKLQRRLDVMDFGTPVKTIDTMAKGNRTKITITPVSDFFEHMAYQSDNLLTIELRPLTRVEKEKIEAEKQVFEGERLTLNFQKIEVRAVLQIIAEFTGMNIVVSDSVSGSLTLRLENVPWDQALDIILKTKGLGMRQNGNVILVAPNTELAASEKAQLESKKQIEELAPLRSEYIQVNYAKAADLAGLLKSESGEGSMMSKRGSVTVDERTNLLLVRDTSQNLGQIRKLIEKLDIPVRQVLIESRIVVANDDFDKALGVRFGYAKDVFSGEDEYKTIGGAVPGNREYEGETAGYRTGSNNDLIVDLPGAASTGNSAALGMAIGKIGSYLLQLELSAMENEGTGEVVSSPRIVTSNQSKAMIEQGVEIPYSEASSSGATSVAYKKAVLSLEVTPLITPDDQVLMDLVVKKDSVSQVSNGAIDTREVTTQVLVQNGETVVLGGIYEQETGKSVQRVPFFGELPIVGNLFKRKASVDNRNELLIFVTPKILSAKLKAN